MTVDLTGNTVADYQKTGILVSGPILATVTGNDVEGYGPVGFIAQNGVRVSFGASAIVSRNSVSDNWYRLGDHLVRSPAPRRRRGHAGQERVRPQPA